MTHLLTFDTIHAEAQHEAFTQLDFAGWRAPVVFSHVLLTHILNNQNIRKGAFIEKSIPATGDFVSRRFVSHLTKEVPGTI